MKREVTICDTSGCRKLADVVCVLCKADHCFEHMPVRLVLRFGTVSPKKPDNPTQPQFAEYDEGVAESVCHACTAFITSPTDEGIHGATRSIPSTKTATMRAFTGRLAVVYAQLVEDIRAMRAAHALGARGEELLQSGAAAATQPTTNGPRIFVLAKEGVTTYWQLSEDGALNKLTGDAIERAPSWPGLPHGWLGGHYIVHHGGKMLDVTSQVVVSREDGLATCPMYLRDRYRAIAEGRT